MHYLNKQSISFQFPEQLSKHLHLPDCQLYLLLNNKKLSRKERFQVYDNKDGLT